MAEGERVTERAAEENTGEQVRPADGERSFQRLLAGTAVSAVGDGMYNTALPLLTADLTRQPLAVSAVYAAGWVPWVLFSLVAGAIVDRVDRRRVMWMTDATRCLLVATIAVTVPAGVGGVWLLVGVAFLLGVGQTLFDTASQVLLPSLVSRDQTRLERANGKVTMAILGGQQFAGPPLGGALFALARPLPFVGDAVSFALSSVLARSVRGRFRPDRGPEPAGVVSSIAEGVRWLWGNRLLRLLALMVTGMNVATGAALSLLVLFAQDVLHLGDVGYGLLMAALSVGGALAWPVMPALRRRVGVGNLLTGLFLGSGALLLAVGLSSDLWVVATCVVLLGAPVVMWNVVTVSLRQMIVPDHLFGRVNSIYKMVGMGGIPIGAVAGGVLAGRFGLHAPFLAAAALLLLVGVVTRAPLMRDLTGLPGLPGTAEDTAEDGGA